MSATAGADNAGGPRLLAVRRPVLAWAAGLVLLGAGLFTLYLRQSLIGPFNSDGASEVLQAQAMLHGNPLLRGWWLADVSFYTTELPEYMIVTAFRGVRPDVVHICGAITYTLTVLLGALLARGRATGWAGLVRALLAGGILLAPGIFGGTEVFLENPDHAGTAVPVLVVLLLLDRAPERWYVPVAVCVLLAWTQIGDELTLIAATVPIAGVALLRLAMLAVRRRPLTEYRYDTLLFAAAAVSNELASLGLWAIRHLGGFHPHSLPRQLMAPVSQVRGNLHVLLQSLLVLFGASSQSVTHWPLVQIEQLHWAGLVLAAAGLAVAVVTFVLPPGDRVTQIVAAATLATLVAGVFGTLLQSTANAHEIAVLLPFGAVLAGRTLPPLALTSWRRIRGSWDLRGTAPARAVAWTAGTVFGVWLAAGPAALSWAAVWTPAGPPFGQLANWLTRHHYTEGLAEYWQSNSVTVASGGKVLVAQVSSAGGFRRWEASADWYDPAHRSANFVIAVADSASIRGGGLSTHAARRYYGRPAHEYRVGPYIVMTYNYNLLTKVTGRAFPGAR